MTRTPEVAEGLVNYKEFVMVGHSGLTRQMSAGSSDIRDLQALALQMADKCRQLFPPSTQLAASADQDIEAERCSVQVEQATQTDNDAGNEKYVAEIDKLKKKLKEVVDMNVGWQMVHEQQQKMLAEMKLQLQQLQSSPATVRPLDLPAEAAVKQQQEQSSDTSSDDLETWKRKCVQLEHDKNELEDSVRCLTSQLESMQDLMRQLEATVDQQHTKLDAVVQEKQSFIDMLQAQILVYREDFQCERQDRERAQGKIVELKTELELLKNRVAEQSAMRQLTRASASAFGQRPAVVARENPYNGYLHQHSARFPPTNAYYPDVSEARLVPGEAWFYPALVGRDEVDCTTDGSDVVIDSLTSDSNRQNVSVDGVMTSDGPVSKADQSAVRENEVSGLLKCPNCRKSYTMDEHVELMDHMETCAAG